MNTEGLPERIRSKITVDISGCWLWTAWVSEKGYGYVFWQGKTVSAHRLTYELLIGPIPTGMSVDHKCPNKHCVNPEHFDICSVGENRRRAAWASMEDKLAIAQSMYDDGCNKLEISYVLGISGRFLKSITRKVG